MLVAAKESSPETIQVSSRVGGVIVPHASALGKVLLAGLGEKDRSPFLQAPLARFTERTIVEPRRLAKVLDDVRKRGYDMHQNAVVGTMLRSLEYFNGTVFATTNLGSDVDDAIVSRAAAVLVFKYPSLEDQLTIIGLSHIVYHRAWAEFFIRLRTKGTA